MDLTNMMTATVTVNNSTSLPPLTAATAAPFAASSAASHARNPAEDYWLLLTLAALIATFYCFLLLFVHHLPFWILGEDHQHHAEKESTIKELLIVREWRDHLCQKGTALVATGDTANSTTADEENCPAAADEPDDNVRTVPEWETLRSKSQTAVTMGDGGDTVATPNPISPPTTSTSTYNATVTPLRTIPTSCLSTPEMERDDSHEDNVDDIESAVDSVDDDGDLCAICLAHFQSRDRVSEACNPYCQHVFHEQCIIRWLGKCRRCPVCRQPYLSKDRDTRTCSRSEPITILLGSPVAH